jgi:hypothetical protein
MSTRPHFSRDLKVVAIKLETERGVTIIQAAHER